LLGACVLLDPPNPCMVGEGLNLAVENLKGFA